MSVERWLSVGWARRYEVSDSGNVRRVGSAENLRGTVTRGYRRVSIRGVSLQVHRIVLEVFVGPCPPGHECAHFNGDSSDNRLTNLRWATSKENAADSIRHGTMQRGSKNGRAKLDEALVVELRRRYRKGDITVERLAKEYGVSAAVANHATSGRTWRHVAEPSAPGSREKGPRGDRHHLAKLTAGDVAEMRGLFVTGDYTKRALALRFGVHYNTCRMALDRVTWRHV